jgi:hypothetical protein
MIDDAAQRVTDWLTGLTADEVRRYLIIGVAALIAYRLLAAVLRRLLPAVLRGLITVLAAALTGLAVLGVLTEGLCARLFRAARMRPPGLVYRGGDAFAAGRQRLRRRAPLMRARTYALRRIPGLAVLAVGATLGWAGHTFTCDRDAGADLCRRPTGAIAELADQAWDNGRKALHFTPQ